MTNETNEPVDSQLDDQEVLDVSEEQDIEVVKAQAKDLADKNRQLFARAKKAEGFELKDNKWVKPEPKPETKPEPTPTPEAKEDITSRDTIAIMKADVHEDDVGDVIEYAKFKGVSVSEALKSTVIKATLAEKAEQRQTAQATSTGKVRSGNAQKSGEGLLERASSSGELPESDEDMGKLADARLDKASKR